MLSNKVEIVEYIEFARKEIRAFFFKVRCIGLLFVLFLARMQQPTWEKACEVKLSHISDNSNFTVVIFREKMIFFLLFCVEC